MNRFHSLSTVTYIPTGKIDVTRRGVVNVIDIYHHRTILYEMMVRKFPFTCDALGFAYEYEAVIFMVGKGKRQEFKTTDVPKKLKVSRVLFFGFSTSEILIFLP